MRPLLDRPFRLGVFATLALAFGVALLLDPVLALALGVAALISAGALLQGTGLTRFTPQQDNSLAARRARRAAWETGAVAGGAFLAGGSDGVSGSGGSLKGRGCSGGAGGGCGGGSGCGGGGCGGGS